MKIDINLAGRAASEDDFVLLRAALVAAQAATPTARAMRAADEAAAIVPAPAPTFADPLATDPSATALAHCFAQARADHQS